MSTPRLLRERSSKCRPKGSVIDTRPPGVKTVDDCIVLLEWACKNGDRCVSLSIIEAETGIPDDTIRMILNQAVEFGVHSRLYSVATCFGFLYHIDRAWNKENRYKPRKIIIDAVRWTDRDYI